MFQQSNSGDDGQIHILEIAGNAIIGGMEKYVFNLIQHLPAHYFKVSCLTPFESPFTANLRQLGCDVYVTEMDNTNPSWQSIQFVTELARYQRVDLIHAHLPRAHLLAGLASKLAGIPAVATIHGMEINPLDLGVARTTNTHLTVVCQQAYSQALALGLPPEQLTLIPNGVDLKAYNPNRSGNNFRKAIHVPPAALLVGCVGRVSWEKGPDQFVEVAKHVNRQLPGVHFALVGEGPMEDEIHAMIQEAGLSEVFHMAGAWENTAEIYPAFDVLVQTSRVEGMPFALLEGMACGKPVAAMGVGGVPEIVEVGTTGILSASGDWTGLGEGLVKLLAQPERMKQMGHAARKRIEDNFDWQTSVRLMLRMFYQVLGKKIPQEVIVSAGTSWPMVKQGEDSVSIDPNEIFRKRK